MNEKMFSTMSRAHRGLRRGIAWLAISLVCGAGPALAISPSHVFYVPFPEADALSALRAINTAAVNPMTSYISIAAIADGTIIYYDHWEDGFELDYNYDTIRQATTQVWGDGNPANGAPPNIPSDVINAGTVILLYNTVDTTQPLTIDFDARDKIVATRAISVTRTYWAAVSGTLFAGCVESFDTAKWGTDYRVPIGVDIPDTTDYQMFEYTAVSIMARDNGTTVRIDADNNGVYETTQTLNEGETAFASNIAVGARVTSDKPIQVVMFSGDIASNYESRDSSLLPVSLWNSNYYTPVSTPDTAATRVWLYNAGAAGITVQYTTRIGTGATSSGTITVGAGSYNAYTMPVGAAARFYTANGAPFYAYSTTDANDSASGYGGNQAWDWSFTLIPERLLSPQMLIGLGIGRDPTSGTNPNENGNPVWITPVGNGSTPVTVYIDYNGDNAGANVDPNGNRYDTSLSLIELQQAKLYDPDGDQTAMLIYVLKTNVTLAAAWGQDTLTAASGEPGLDVGTSIPPIDVIDVNKSLTVVNDVLGDNLLGPADRAAYTIRVNNTSRAPIPASFIVRDTLDAGLTYVAASTAFRNSTNATWSAVADDVTGTPFPLDGAGLAINNSIPVKDSYEVRFLVDVAPYGSLVASQVSMVNTGEVTAIAFDRVVKFRNETDLHGSIGDRVWFDANGNGVQDAGEPGIAGVKVYLDLDNNGALDAGEPYDITDGAGNYLLTGTLLKAGTYSIRVDATTLPSGYTQTYDLDGLATAHAATVTLAAGQNRTDADFGYSAVAQLSGSVFWDIDGDGTPDAEDTTGLAGVTLLLLDATSNAVASASTSATGFYSFANVVTGTYTVVQILPASWTNTYDVVGANDRKILRTLTPNLNSSGNNFYDTRSGTPALAGKVLYLSDPSQALDRIDPVSTADATTASTAALTTAGGSSVIAVVGAAAVSTSTRTATTHSFSYNSGATGANRILMVGISYRDNDNELVTAVTYGGQAMTVVGTANAPFSTPDGRIYIYRLLNPSTGANTLQVNWGSALNNGAVVGAVTYSGVSQTTPTGTFASASNTGSTTPAVTVTSATGQLVFGVVAGRTTTDYAVTGGGTSLWTSRPYSGETAGSAQSKTGAASVNLSWSGANQEWVAGGVSLIPATGAGAPSATFTQTPVFELPFNLASGALITITNYVNVTSGTMPANPAVTARLSAGGMTILTLSNPTYSGGALSWSGTLGSSVSIPVGQSIALSVSNAQSGVEFQIRYDSATYPSKIIMPTASIIAVPSLGIYDAAYPEGNLVSTSPITAKRYVRLTVTDPFGAYDITSAQLAIDGPGVSGDVSATLTDLNVVASNGWSKTYEYVWQTLALSGSYAITVTANEGSEGITASGTTTETLLASSIGDFTWVDTNGNGQQNGGEIGLSNVVVRLYDSNNAVVGVTTSTVSGAYAFTNLLPGNYTVGFTPPAGYLFTTSNVGNDATDSDPLTGTNRTAVVTLTSSQSNATVDAGFYPPASVAGFVRVDVNGNGVAEAGDTNGIAGGTVQLLDAALNVVATTTTASNGSYSFTGLLPGFYTVRETDLTGWYSTTDTAAPNDNLIPVTLAISQNSAGNNFHDTQRATLGNFTWVDANGNGQQDGGEVGLSNVVVRLYDVNSVVLATVTSSVSGAYAFTSLATGAYTLGFTPPVNYLFTTSNVGNDATDSDPLAGTNRTAAITLTSGQTDNTVDAGFIPSAAIAGFVRVDVNGNGIAETGDTNGIAGVTVQLMDAASNVVATAITAANGSYSFANLRPGNYTVRETDLNGWYSTLDTAGPNDNQVPITLAIGQNASGNIFYDTQRTTVGDFVWVDTNGNGQQDGGEPGLSNVVVRLYDVNNVIVGTTTSTVSGAYAFTSLIAGTYTVGFTQPANTLFTTSNVGNVATDSNPLTGTNRTAAITLTSGQTDNTVDAGFIPSALIAGFVRVDVNGNGIAETGDTNGIAGVTVQLLDAASNVVATAITAANGSYSFSGLRPGSYTVRETDLTGWYSTTDTAAPNDNLIPVTLAVGQVSVDNDFHDAQRAGFGDRVWNDLDGDGVQDGFEPGLAAVRVYVDSNGNGVHDVGEASASSAADGSYQISSLFAGSYTARVDVATLPAGFIQTYDLNGALDHAAWVALDSNQTRTDVDFGYRSTTVYTISGQVRDDYDLNGVFSDPDQPVGGVLITLYSDPNGDGNPADGVVISSQRTTATGRYAFTGLLSGAYVVVETDPVYSVSTADKVGANDNRIPVVIIDADASGRDFLDAVDPSGYIYDVADGRIVPGGSISVTGPGADVLMDGSSGQYMFVSTNNAPGTYTIAVTPPPDYVLDLTRPVHSGSFDPTGGANPSVLGSTENASTPGYLVNYSAASNTYYFTFDLAPGDPPVINNNFPVKKIVLEVTGTVFNDVNRLTDNTVNGIGTDAGGLFANLVDPWHTVIASVPVAANGTYRFIEADGVTAYTIYDVTLTAAQRPVNSFIIWATLPPSWVSTGEHVGAGPGSDGVANSSQTAFTTADGVREVNFGIVSVPDLTPVITVQPNVMIGPTSFEVWVECVELLLFDTSGTIILRVPKDGRWTMTSWDPSATNLPVSNLAVNNTEWTLTQDATTYIFTTDAMISGGTQLNFGFTAAWNAAQTSGTAAYSVNIDSGSGGEVRTSNNSSSASADYTYSNN